MIFLVLFDVFHLLLVLIVLILFFLLRLPGPIVPFVPLDGLLCLIDYIAMGTADSSLCMLLRVLVLAVVGLQVADVVLEAQLVQREQQIVPVDGLAVAPATTLTRLARNERNVLAHTLLDGFTRFLRDFSVLWEGFLHYPADVSDWQVPVLFLIGA